MSLLILDFRFFSKGILLLLCLLNLTACGTIRYLFQAGQGQWALSNHARPIDEVLKDEKASPFTRQLLSQVDSIKKFGEEYGLRPTKNYKDYVELDRPYVVWVVSACESLKFNPKEWRFPLLGSFTYLGWFDKDAAQDFGEELKLQGWDVYVRGAGAYSTLGWFRDSILSSMISKKRESAMGDLANVILHESVHATYYVKNQSYFNESLASFVADALTPRYLEKQFGQDSKEFSTYQKNEEENEKYKEAYFETYTELQKLYESSKSDEEKKQKKMLLLNGLKNKLKLEKEINNAALIQYRTYGTGLKEFEMLLKMCEFNWSKFWERILEIKNESFKVSQEEDIQKVLLPFIERGECR